MGCLGGRGTPLNIFQSTRNWGVRAQLACDENQEMEPCGVRIPHEISYWNPGMLFERNFFPLVWQHTLTAGPLCVRGSAERSMMSKTVVPSSCLFNQAIIKWWTLTGEDSVAVVSVLPLIPSTLRKDSEVQGVIKTAPRNYRLFLDPGIQAGWCSLSLWPGITGEASGFRAEFSFVPSSNHFC